MAKRLVRAVALAGGCALFAGLFAGLCVGSGGCAEWLNGAGSDYAPTASGNYDRAMALLKRQNYPEAIKLFAYIKSKFTFSKFATLSELRIADANFGREKYQDAVEGYRNFIKNHPTNEDVTNGYADFRIGESFHKEIPSSWFLVPPSYEKDQGPVRDALRELAAFVSAFPNSTYAEKARKLEEDCVRRLADHEFYVANFYLKKKKPLATVGRLEGLLKGSFLPKLAAETPGTASSRMNSIAKEYLQKNLEPQVLLLLGETYMKMDKQEQARQAFERLVETHPEDVHAKKARLDLDQIARHPVPAPAPESAPAATTAAPAAAH